MRSRTVKHVPSSRQLTAHGGAAQNARAMPLVAEAALQELRMRYRAAYTAYQACSRALTEAATSGAIPSPMLLEQEAKALAVPTKTRADLLAAMSAAAGAVHPPAGEPPPQSGPAPALRSEGEARKPLFRWRSLGESNPRFSLER